MDTISRRGRLVIKCKGLKAKLADIHTDASRSFQLRLQSWVSSLERGCCDDDVEWIESQLADASKEITIIRRYAGKGKPS